MQRIANYTDHNGTKITAQYFGALGIMMILTVDGKDFDSLPVEKRRAMKEDLRDRVNAGSVTFREVP